MGRNDADFAAYLAARWPFLVRTVVLLGCPPDKAGDVVRTGLAGCYSSWDRVRRADDVDVHVYRTVLASWRRARKRRDTGRRDTGPETALVEDPTERVLLRRALEGELDRLDAEHREVLVLGYVAGLTEPQVADVLDIDVDTVQSRETWALTHLDLTSLRDLTGGGQVATEEIFRRASESVDVLARPADDVIALARAHRRRTRRTVVAGVAVAALVVAGGSWWASRPAAEDVQQLRVVRAADPVAVAWWADGRLHLDAVEVSVPSVVALGQVGHGAVYVDAKGAVASVGPDGLRTVIGHQDADQPLAVSSEAGWAAWVDPTGDSPRLVVYDVAADRAVGTLDLPTGADAHPIAIDQAHVFYATSGGDFSWTPSDGDPVPTEKPGLIDVASAVRVYQEDQLIEMVQPFFSVSYLRPGTGALLSADGYYALSRTPAEDPTAPYSPLLYDVRSGLRQPPGVSIDERVIDAAFGSDGTVVYVVGRVEDFGSGADLDGNDSPLLTLRRCVVGGRCADVTPLPPGAARPVLAH